MIVASETTAAAQLPPCASRPRQLSQPWVRGDLYCLEEVIHVPDATPLSFSSLAVDTEGILYATNPYDGTVVAFDDTNGDFLPDATRTIASDLTRPHGITYHDGFLYVAGGQNIYQITQSQVEILVSDLPGGGGFWVGGLSIGSDERLYVAVGSSCDACQPDDPERGAILSFALDGSDRQVVARGLRFPGDITHRGSEVWTVDTARDDLGDVQNLDEVNHVRLGAHYGWPQCIGQDNRPDLFVGTFDCTTAVAPGLSLPTHSIPTGLAYYESDIIPRLADTLLITLSGKSNQAMLTGYVLAAIHFGEDGKPLDYEIILPEQFVTPHTPVLTLQNIHVQASGVWPHHPLDVAVSPEGWIYLSVSNGRILALRPH